MVELRWPNTPQEAIAYIVWAVLIVGFGIEFCNAITHEEFLRAFISFVAMAGIAAMAVYKTNVRTWIAATNPNYVAPALMLLLLAIILSPFIEQQRWPFSNWFMPITGPVIASHSETATVSPAATLVSGPGRPRSDVERVAGELLTMNKIVDQISDLSDQLMAALKQTPEKDRYADILQKLKSASAAWASFRDENNYDIEDLRSINRQPFNPLIEGPDGGIITLLDRLVKVVPSDAPATIDDNFMQIVTKLAADETELTKYIQEVRARISNKRTELNATFPK